MRPLRRDWSTRRKPETPGRWKRMEVGFAGERKTVSEGWVVGRVAGLRAGMATRVAGAGALGAGWAVRVRRVRRRLVTDDDMRVGKGGLAESDHRVPVAGQTKGRHDAVAVSLGLEASLLCEFRVSALRRPLRDRPSWKC